jgi:hypothetical protein
VGSNGFDLAVIADKADPARCWCSGAALASALVGVQGAFEIHAHDRFKNLVYLTQTSFEVLFVHLARFRNALHVGLAVACLTLASSPAWQLHVALDSLCSPCG